MEWTKNIFLFHISYTYLGAKAVVIALVPFSLFILKYLNPLVFWLMLSRLIPIACNTMTMPKAALSSVSRLSNNSSKVACNLGVHP